MAQFSQPAQPANSIFSQPAKSSPMQTAIQQPQPQSNPAFNLFAAGSSSQQSSKPATPAPSSQPPPAKADPFASLSQPPRQNSPFQFQQSTRTPQPQQQQQRAAPSSSSGGGIDLLGMDNAAPAPAASAPAPAPASNDDEWTFSSALPDQPADLTVTNTTILTQFAVSRSSDTELLIQSRISNNAAQPITDLTFQLAVTKGYTLNLQPQSSRNLAANQKAGITQTIRLQGVERGKGQSIKMRWRASYTVVGKGVENEQGEITGLGVS